MYTMVVFGVVNVAKWTNTLFVENNACVKVMEVKRRAV